MTPEKFVWAKGFLSSQLWDTIKEPIQSEQTIKFPIPHKCVATQATMCKLIADKALAALFGEEETPLSPKIRMRDGKLPLVESEVRRSQDWFS
jgi:hypothetical protein